MAQNPYDSVYAGPEASVMPNAQALGPRSAYAAPEGKNSPYVDEAAGNWGPKIGALFSAGTDSFRLGTMPHRDFYPDAQHSPEEGFYPQRDADKAVRHNVEIQDADGWQEQKGNPPRFAPNPRSAIIEEPRPTSRLAPRSYSFLRPFDQHSARTFNGMHFSMADHRRVYETHGMAPARSARNTYRIEPAPWDQRVVDMPANPNEPRFDGKITAVEVAPAGNRSYRL